MSSFRIEGKVVDEIEAFLYWAEVVSIYEEMFRKKVRANLLFTLFGRMDF
jgi:hypothetical protein